MAEKLTPQQLCAVSDRGGKLLVSAAAGSGKTKVLVDRLLSYLTDPVDPANIDDFLIITYTKAAAAELRGKIAAKLSQRIAEEPENRHLQRQMQRLYLAKISTVHAFCTDLLREHAYRLDISADFRVAEENECLELQLSVVDKLLNSAYENAANDPDFCAFVDTQGLGRDDRLVPKILLQVYNSARCHLDPQGWLDKCLQHGSTQDITDAAQTTWGQYLLDELRDFLQLHIAALEKCLALGSSVSDLAKPMAVIADTIFQLRRLHDCRSWDETVQAICVDFGRLTFPRKPEDPLLVDKIKAVRNACKKALEKKQHKFKDDSAQILADMRRIEASTRGLVALTRRFMDDYAALKRSRRVLDFSDLEHLALDLLIGKSRSGPTAIADEVSRRYREVMVDEYQDSNAVQDAIFGAITRIRQNCFMVGDVKQSIYQFRLADPGIFLEKYTSYVPAKIAQPGEGRKVLLSHNFRSAGAVIGAVNDVFSHCMSQEVGGLDYGEDEALREGIPHAEVGEPEIELHGIRVTDDTYGQEADYVAARIHQLVDEEHFIRDGDGLRRIRPEDIVILLRSPGSVGATFAKALAKWGIRCNFGGSVDILRTDEVLTLRAILRTIDNPLQDIPLVAALMSPAFGFTADDIAAIRADRKGGSIYHALKKSENEKATAFLTTLNILRRESRLKDLSALLQAVFAYTKLDSIYAAMPDGEVRVENLQAFCQLVGGFEASGAKSLSRFLRHLEALDEKGVPGTAEQNAAGAVTIMSIHKSKGLEFPVVFLSGLARSFNRDSLRQQVLCHKELGLGLSCVDMKNRVRYPSIAKRAIMSKLLRESISEELRVLYVAMTRPKDRLIMTYAFRNAENELSQLTMRMDLSDPMLLTGDVDCPGQWVLYSALHRSEAGAFFACGGYPGCSEATEKPWLITLNDPPEAVSAGSETREEAVQPIDEQVLEKLKIANGFRYPHQGATVTPSKQTATQIKGRQKDKEAAQDAKEPPHIHRSWRKPSFISKTVSGRDYGNALHAVMQYIDFARCDQEAGIASEISRLTDEGYISSEQASLVEPSVILGFFSTQMGQKLRVAPNVIREFKFSILDDGAKYGDGVTDDSVLLQGVVDCAIIAPDGIEIIDFKTDRVTEETLRSVAQGYRMQVMTYADALSRIYGLPVTKTRLYFFSIGQFVDM